MDETPFRAAVVGASSCAVRREIAPHIQRELAHWEVREFSRLRELIEAVETQGEFADLVIVCQSWRDEYAAQEVKAGLASLPVSRWMCVVGPWCESEGRHGSRWPLAIRVPLHSWRTRLTQEIDVVHGWLPALAITAAREEAFAFDRQSLLPKHAGPTISTIILSPDREWKAWIRDLCQSGGLQPIEPEPGISPEILILDLDPLTSTTPATVQTWKAEYPHSLIVGCLGLVYPEDRQRFQEMGVAVLLSKLTPAVEILSTLLESQRGNGEGSLT